MPKHRGPSANINQSNQLLLNYLSIFVHHVVHVHEGGEYGEGEYVHGGWEAQGRGACAWGWGT